MISRRSFLSTLGIAASGIALVPNTAKIAGKWLIPENVVAYDGPVSLEWILAESLAVFAANLDHQQFRHVDQPAGVRPGATWRGIDFQIAERELQRSRKEFREIYIEPGMNQLAQAIRNVSPKPLTCLALEVPRGVEFAGRMVNEQHGLDLRFVRAWHMGDEGFTDFDGSYIPGRPPGWINRFDVCVA